MRTRKSLERLAAAAPTDSLVVGHEQDAIFERIVQTARSPLRRRQPVAIALVAAVVIGAFVAIAVTRDHHAASPPSVRGGHHHVALTGPPMQFAGYHFKTPAGFAASKESCVSTVGGGDGFAAAATADGACVEAAFIVAGDWLETHDPIPASAVAVDVGDYRGLYVAADGSSDASSLYVALPHGDAQRVVYVLLVAHGVPEDELIAIAASGLPTLPPEVQPVTTTG